MERAIPVLRIDNYDAAKAFYCDRLGFQIEWEWRHEPNFPVYMRMSRGNLVLHLTEHRGDCNGQGAIYAEVGDVDALYREWKEKEPGMQQQVETQPWGQKELLLIDPFGNRLCFASPV